MQIRDVFLLALVSAILFPTAHSSTDLSVTSPCGGNEATTQDFDIVNGGCPVNICLDDTSQIIQFATISGNGNAISGMNNSCIMLESAGDGILDITLTVQCNDTEQLVNVSVNVSSPISLFLNDDGDGLVEGMSGELCVMMNDLDCFTQVTLSTSATNLTISESSLFLNDFEPKCVNITALVDDLLEGTERVQISAMITNTNCSSGGINKSSCEVIAINDTNSPSFIWFVNDGRTNSTTINIIEVNTNSNVCVQVMPSVADTYSLNFSVSENTTGTIVGAGTFTSSQMKHCFPINVIYNTKLTLIITEEPADLFCLTIFVVATDEVTTLPPTSSSTTLSTSTASTESTTTDTTTTTPAASNQATVITIVLALVLGLLVLGALVLLAIWLLLLSQRKKKKHAGYLDSASNDVLMSGNNLEAETNFGSVKPSRDIPMSEFPDHVTQMHSDHNRGFEMEYKSIRNPSRSNKVAQIPKNQQRNRFFNILPYDDNLVSLEVSTDANSSDYINASWIDGYKRKNAYIACQGPIPESVGDFWRMIWQYKLSAIVMVTRLVEGAKVKCHRYWPDKLGDKLSVGDGLTVRLDEMIPCADYDISTLTLTNLDESNGVNEMKITHCYYTGWPDHDVPKYPTSMLGFLRRVRKLHPPDKQPLVVHCSAGVGRSGTFITMDTMLQRMRDAEDLNVNQFVREMRQKRCFMVQTESQYIFIHDALKEIICCGNTEIPAMNLRIVISKLQNNDPDQTASGFELQFKRLEEVSRKPAPGECDGAEDPETVAKNRFQDILPYKLHCPAFHSVGYINASYIDGYRKRRAFITTQGPLQDTITDFWQMVEETHSKCLVMLCKTQEDEKECSAQYWPQEVDSSLELDKHTISLISEEQSDDIVVRKLKMKKPSGEEKVVTQFHHADWNENGPQPLLKLCDLVVKAQRSTGNHGITVICSDGSGRCGTFVALYSEIERLKTEGVIDVFQCIKAARIQRFGLVANVAQYSLIHTALASFMDKFETYANFA